MPSDCSTASHKTKTGQRCLQPATFPSAYSRLATALFARFFTAFLVADLLDAALV